MIFMHCRVKKPFFFQFSVNFVFCFVYCGITSNAEKHFCPFLRLYIDYVFGTEVIKIKNLYELK